MTTNLALLGGGVFAQSAYSDALSKPSNKHINLHTIWSRSETSAKKMLAAITDKGLAAPRILFGEQGLQQVLDDKDIDGVMLVLPITSQPALIRRCWAAGKHVLSEKPMERDVAQGVKFVDEYYKDWKPKGLIWRVAENDDYEPMHKEVNKILMDPAIGPVLYWDMVRVGYVEDGSKWIATEWRTVPDYQGGFILDGGVHMAAMLRNVLPNPPATIISSASLHRTHLPPHDTVIALSLPSPSATLDPSGPPTQLNAINKVSDIPAELGKSIPAGTITMSWGAPDLDSQPPMSLTITCLNAKVSYYRGDEGWTVEVDPAKGSKVKKEKRSEPTSGIERHCGYFARAVQAVKSGNEVNNEEDLGRPETSLWDVAFIQALLTSNGEKVDIQGLIDSGKKA